ncbi:cytochrome c1 [Hyphobacterium marinum]|uniref:Cytochrome c1 n=1 Tax=Hyphobacterium marinum TaxID=3116574 RepID=A0ABU7LX98_9PROT|nr:cytochrome c1 [Hyphobacterium sp. Y6023]MEE2566150.1 cytochrome c1 [Hyphobacterium sp. Y6023]
MTITRILAVSAALLVSAPALAAEGEQHHPEQHDWTFAGPFGTFDRDQLQRGFQVYQEVCAACHGLDMMSFRNLGEEGGPFYDPEYPNPNDNEVVRWIAEQYVITDGPDDLGEMFERPGIPADSFPNPYPNPQAARASNGGALPPDLSLIVNARHDGANYVRSLLLGYGHEAPEGVTVRPGQYYNPYFPGGLLAMGPQLTEGRVSYTTPEGGEEVEATPEQMAEDVVAFLAWATDPHATERKRTGLIVLIYMLILCGLTWFAYRQVWSNQEH